MFQSSTNIMVFRDSAYRITIMWVIHNDIFNFYFYILYFLPNERYRYYQELIINSWYYYCVGTMQSA